MSELLIQYIVVAQDPIIGRYFIDHIRKRNVVDDPRRTASSFSDQLKQVLAQLSNTESLLLTKKETLALRQQELVALESLKSVKSQLETDRSEQDLKQLCLALAQDILRLEALFKDLKTTADRIQADTTLPDQLPRQQQIQQEILQLKDAIIDEQQVQHTLFQSLQQAVCSLAPQEKEVHQLVAKAAQAFSSNLEANNQGTHLESNLNGYNRQPTRVEREIEYTVLKRRLQEERLQTARLKEVAEAAQLQVERALRMADDTKRVGHLKPEWIRLLNQYAHQSSAIKRQARERAISAVQEGGVMSFKEKLLFFTSGPLDGTLVEEIKK